MRPSVIVIQLGVEPKFLPPCHRNSIAVARADHLFLIVDAWPLIERWAPASCSPLTALTLETTGATKAFQAGE